MKSSIYDKGGENIILNALPLEWIQKPIHNSRNFQWFMFYVFSFRKELSLCHKLNFVITISLEPDDVNLWYFKLRLFDLTEFIGWNNHGLRPLVAKIEKLENLSLWQRLSSFVIKLKFNIISVIVNRYDTS